MPDRESPNGAGETIAIRVGRTESRHGMHKERGEKNILMGVKRSAPSSDEGAQFGK